MNIDVLLFAGARERAGTDRLSVELPTGATVRSLFEHLAAEHPSLAAVLPSCRAAVDEEFAQPATPLTGGAVVAILPPVSGGC